MVHGLDTLDSERSAGGWPWLSRLALAWIVGLVVGSYAAMPLGWAISGAITILVGAFLLRKRSAQGAQWSGLIAISLIAGAWLVVQRDDVSEDHLVRVIHDEPALAGVRGTIASPPRDVIPGRSAFGRFNYQGPGTLFELSVDAVDVGSGFEPTTGTLLVRIKQHDHRPKLGQRIEAFGWMSAIGPTQNPGEFDYRAYLREQGVVGRITLMRRGNWRALSDPPVMTLTGIRRSIGDAAASSLRIGMPGDSERMGLLDALLLGRRTGDMDELSDSFRAVGLSHVLSISGAHLGILLLIVWGLGRLLIGRPSLVTLLVLAVLVLFLLAVPWRTPILRAAIMAAVFCFGYGLGRRVTGLEMLSAAVLIVLIWRPGDVFDAGFQLSFGVVGAILLFARPFSRWLLAEPEAKVVHPSPWDLGLRWAVDLFAVSVVAFWVALPIVMYHFQLVSPLAVLLSLFALPALTVVLALGYLKIITGLLSPAVGSLLAVPLSWASDSLSGLVVQAERLPAASFTLLAQPSVAWALGAVAYAVAGLAGCFKRRRLAMMLCLTVIVGWAWYEQLPRGVMDQADPPALVVNMFSVGDGSCYLLRSGEQTLMFDCGSRAFWRIGERSIVPALSSLGVRRIDMLMVSHADLDHFVGVLDVLDHIEVEQVLVSPDVLREAEAEPNRAAGYLVSALRSRGIEPEPIERGWTKPFGDGRLEVLWPAADYASELNNNNSLVLRAEAAGRSVLLNGDIQNEAIELLLEQPVQLKADVTDLAHHGSFVALSPDWLEAVGPELVLQSSGPKRRGGDRWQQMLDIKKIDRLWTNALGMVQLEIAKDGEITTSSHREDEAGGF